jgi:nitrite reductase (NADH) large subunit
MMKVGIPTWRPMMLFVVFASLTTVEAFVPRPLSTPPSSTFITTALDAENKKQVVVVGNGMVGQRFMENLRKVDPNADHVDICTFGEEPRAAYNRVKLTSYFETRDPSALSMTSEFQADGTTSWYTDHNVQLHLNDKVVQVDTQQQTVTSATGKTVPYDVCVMATGSFPFVPPIPGKQRPGVFVYRTIEDLEAMLHYAKEHNVQSAAVIGGGLLGLEAAKAAKDIGIPASHIIEFAPILMCRQIDDGGHALLTKKIESMGIQVHCNARTEAIVGQDGSTDMESMSPVAALTFSNDDWDDLPVQMVIVSAGIKPRDELARATDGVIAIGERGGIVVNEQCQTSVDNIYAIGEIALYNNFIYGLIAPGYTMANVAAKCVADQLGIVPFDKDEDQRPAFTGADMSTKLKLLGCDVASFGVNQPRPDDEDVSYLTWNDPVGGVYRKLVLNKDGTKLRGGILVGDASDYDALHTLAVKQKDEELSVPAAMLLAPPGARGNDDAASSGIGDATISDDPTTQICSCNDVTRGDIAAVVAELGVEGATLAAVKKCSQAGTGCGGCEPQVKNILKSEIEKLGGTLSNHLCEHFSYSRPELMALIRTNPDITSVDSFEKILHKHGNGGDGCELCKPVVGSILASLVNDVIIDDGRDALQDTNDRAMANMQRGGTYSVVPRVPGGELLPDQLIALGETAKKYNLYTKVTGAQRVDLFGAAKHELPDIWEDLGKAGFESGHAYGKALRTVKSCVGSTWCRYGVQDSVSFAVQVENRYKGIRSPHKMKSAVSGCARECAEAQSKDFGMIATENGYNLYFGGNGGTNPVHAELFAADIDEDTVLKYIDRYLMYYILTADKLERTAVWQKKLPSGKNGGGPIEHLREVIIEDSLGICDELDSRMAHLVNTYHDEWAEVVKDPARRAKFQQFANTDKNIAKEDMLEFIDMRGQQRPADWPKDGEAQTMWQAPDTNVFAKSEKSWVRVGSVSDFAPNVGTPILYSDTQLAIFNNAHRGEWYCTQNMCPHKQAFVLSQGLVGDAAGTPKVACPLHKKQFSLEDGVELGAEEPLSIITFPVKVEGNDVWVELPAELEVDAILGTHGLRVTKSDCIDIAGDALKVPSRFAKVMKAGQEFAETLTGVRKETSSTVLQATSTNTTDIANSSE